MQIEASSKPKAQIHVIRVSEDIREMVNAIASYEMTGQLEIADTLIREVVEARFRQLPKEMQARALARIEAAAK